MFKFILNLLLILSLSTFFVSCSNDESSPTENKINPDPNAIPDFQAGYTYEPQYESPNLKYVFNFYVTKEKQMDTAGYQYRFDVNNDGLYEQDWSGNNSFTLAITQPEKASIKLEAKSSGGRVSSYIDTIYLIKNITIPHELGSNQGDAVWDRSGSNKIVFTWGDQIGQGIHQIFIADYTTGNINQLTIGENADCRHYPEWSADGKKIYFPDNRMIGRVDIATQRIDTLISNVNDCMSLACSRDGQYLYFCGSVNGKQGLFRFIFSSGTLEYLSDFFEHPIAISPDGTKIVADDANKIKIYDLSQHQLIKEFNTGIISEDRIEWSPDGRYITLTYVDSLSSIRLLDLQKEKYVDLKVTGLAGILSWGYTWSPDGEFLAFSGTLPGRTRTSLWCIKPELE